MTTKFVANIAKFFCEKCEYITNNKYDLKKHLLTRKHLETTKGLQETTSKSPTDKCFECFCGKSYIHHSSLYKHKKICKNIAKVCDKSHNDESSKNSISSMKSQDLVSYLMKENIEFKEMIKDQNSKIIELAKEGRVITTNNNTNNIKNKFNMNIFLNC